MRGRGPASCAPEPLTGTYRTTILREDLEAQNCVQEVDLIGGGQLKLGAGTGKHLCCLAGAPVNGVYEWTAASETLRVTAIDDLCLARRVVLTAHPLRRIGP